MEKIVSLCKRRGFIFQGSEIYGGLNGVWDYGPLGVELKRNLKDYWWRVMVRERDDVVGMDGAILTHRAVLKASGHEDTFSDPMVRMRVVCQASQISRWIRWSNGRRIVGLLDGELVLVRNGDVTGRQSVPLAVNRSKIDRNPGKRKSKQNTSPVDRSGTSRVSCGSGAAWHAGCR